LKWSESSDNMAIAFYPMLRYAAPLRQIENCWILRGDTFPKRCHLFNPGVTESIPFVYFNSLSLRPKMFFFTGRPDGHKVSQRIAVVGTNREKMNSGTEQNLSSTLSADSSKNLIILVIDGLKLNPPCYLI